MFSHDPSASFSHDPRLLRIREQPIAGGEEIELVFGLNRGAGLEEPCGDIRKIAHVRAEQHRLSAGRRLNRILPALMHETSPDHRDVSESLKPAQIAHAIDHDDRR